MSRWREIVDFARTRTITARPKPKAQRRLWSLWRTPVAEIERLRQVAASGRRLALLIKTEAWKDVLDAKAYYQAAYDAQTKTVSTTHEQRYAAAVAWSTLEGFFKEVELRIKRGADAQQELEHKVQDRSFA